jgi:hypothetical protein
MLSPNRLVSATINLSPLAAAGRNFGILNIAGDSNVISGLERIRSYTNLTDVATDFGTSAPEYLAALLYFGQSPKPATLNISRWLRTATAGLAISTTLSASDQLLANFTAITAGTLNLSVDGSAKTLTGINLSTATNLNMVAALITTALSAYATCVWTGTKFQIISATTGASSTVTASTGTVATLLKMTTAQSPTIVPGYIAETALACANALVGFSPAWYGLTFASSVMPSTSDYLAVAGYIEALSISRMFGVSTIDTAVLDNTQSTDIASQLMALGYKHTFVQYSSANPYSCASMFGRAFAVDFTANRSTITLMYKQEPGIVAENITNTQADTLLAKRCNAFVGYVNSTNIIQYGVMSGPAYFDEIHGLDWFQDSVQTAGYNLLYTSLTKIPQTDSGVSQIIAAVAGVCEAAVNNGLVAPGTWTADGFGQLATGQFMKTGYYIYAASVATQSDADRAARKSPPIQVALKLAGAIHTINMLINVNR